MTAPELLSLQLIDEVIPEPGEGAHTDWDAAANLLRERLVKITNELRSLTSEQLIRQRQEKYRRMASFFEETGV
jgi:acetyl-CoA carboxylase carboxyl transferase subunit alpha